MDGKDILKIGFAMILGAIPLSVLGYFCESVPIFVAECFCAVAGLFIMIFGGVVGTYEGAQEMICTKIEEEEMKIKERKNKMKKMKSFVENL